MDIKRKVLFPVAIGLAIINAAGAVYAVAMSESVHAFVHGVVLVGSVIWARYLWQVSPRSIHRPEEKVASLEANVSDLERQLSETQQRLDFADQLLQERKKLE